MTSLSGFRPSPGGCLIPRTGVAPVPLSYPAPGWGSGMDLVSQALTCCPQTLGICCPHGTPTLGM